MAGLPEVRATDLQEFRGSFKGFLKGAYKESMVGFLKRVLFGLNQGLFLAFRRFR